MSGGPPSWYLHGALHVQKAGILLLLWFIAKVLHNAPCGWTAMHVNSRAGPAELQLLPQDVIWIPVGKGSGMDWEVGIEVYMF